MKFSLKGQNIELPIQNMINAGYAGCNQEVVKAHIAELAEIGVKVPECVPTFYPVPVQQLTQENVIQVGHDKTSAEIEYVFIHSGGKSYLTVGSDHSDRELEAHSVCAAKQICPNVIAGELWEYDAVSEHFDSLRLLCEVYEEENGWRICQDGFAADILKPEQLLELGKDIVLDEGRDLVLYSGTIPTIGEITYGSKWRISMIDLKLDHKITFEYAVKVLPKCIE